MKPAVNEKKDPWQNLYT